MCVSKGFIWMDAQTPKGIRHHAVDLSFEGKVFILQHSNLSISRVFPLHRPISFECDLQILCWNAWWSSFVDNEITSPSPNPNLNPKLHLGGAEPALRSQSEAHHCDVQKGMHNLSVEDYTIGRRVVIVTGHSCRLVGWMGMPLFRRSKKWHILKLFILKSMQ